MSPAVYKRRELEKTLLYRAVQEHLETFLALAESGEGRTLPAFVQESFRRYLECGILQKGFVRVRCPDCGHEMVVAFS